MQQVYNLINKVADTDSTVLIMAKAEPARNWSRAACISTATGNIILSSRSIAAHCRRICSSRNCSGTRRAPLPVRWRISAGLFEEANLGTIFLDEVNSMAPPLQTKLLRVLQEREVRRVGDNKSSPVNVRVVGATNEPLQPKSKTEHFAKTFIIGSPLSR